MNFTRSSNWVLKCSSVVLSRQSRATTQREPKELIEQVFNSFLFSIVMENGK